LEPSGAQRSQIDGFAIAAACVLAATLLIALTRVAGPPCLSRVLFHVSCPGCGLTRSLVALWHGDLLTSFRYHPLGPPLFACCIAIIAGWLLSASFPAMRPRLDRAVTALLGTPVMRCVLVLLLGVWAVRVVLAASGNGFFLW
jgi:hypothetical protein